MLGVGRGIYTSSPNDSSGGTRRILCKGGSVLGVGRGRMSSAGVDCAGAEARKGPDTGKGREAVEPETMREVERALSGSVPGRLRGGGVTGIADAVGP